MNALAVDVGGTKVAVAVVSRDARILSKTQQPTNLHGVERVIEQIAQMSAELLGETRPDAVGLSVPAVIDVASDQVLWAPTCRVGKRRCEGRTEREIRRACQHRL